MLEEFYKEELQDEEKYRKFAAEIEKEYPKYAKIFRDLAYEESTHANIIKNLIPRMKQGEE